MFWLSGIFRSGDRKLTFNRNYQYSVTLLIIYFKIAHKPHTSGLTGSNWCDAPIFKHVKKHRKLPTFHNFNNLTGMIIIFSVTLIQQIRASNTNKCVGAIIINDFWWIWYCHCHCDRFHHPPMPSDLVWRWWENMLQTLVTFTVHFISLMTALYMNTRTFFLHFFRSFWCLIKLNKFCHFYSHWHD